MKISRITASKAAKYILSLSDPDQGDIISNLKLQKLLYYTQGIHLAVYNKPLFDDPIYVLSGLNRSLNISLWTTQQYSAIYLRIRVFLETS